MTVRAGEIYAKSVARGASASGRRFFAYTTLNARSGMLSRSANSPFFGS